MKNILRKIFALAIEEDCMEELVEVVRQFEDVKVIKIRRNLLARVVSEKLWLWGPSSHTSVEKITVILC